MNKCYNLDLGPKRSIGMTRRSVSGIYVFRGVTSIPHESTLERDFLIRSEFFLNVLQILPQPVRIPFTGADGRQYSYVPDFLVMYRPTKQGCRRPLLVEVKPSEQWNRHWRKWGLKWEAAIRYAKQYNWRFQIQDESRIRDIVLQNVRYLRFYKRMRFEAEDSQRAIETLRSIGPTSIGAILDQHYNSTSRSQGMAFLWHLVAVRKLDCEITGPMNHHTKLWVPDDE